MDIKEISKGFDEFQFKKISKSRNGAAHALAREGLRTQVGTYLDDWLPVAAARAIEYDGRGLGRFRGRKLREP